MTRSTTLATGLAAALLAAAGSAAAADHTVAMRNRDAAGGVMAFEPAFVQAEVGDIVTFTPADAGHNAELIAGMAPVGVVQPAGRISKAWTLKLAKPGVYGVECLPHFGLGMVALVRAGRGAPPNLAAAAAVKLPPLAQARMAPLLAQAR